MAHMIWAISYRGNMEVDFGSEIDKHDLDIFKNYIK